MLAAALVVCFVREHEIDVRMALGASQAQIVWMVLRAGLLLALAGVALGALGAWGSRGW